VCVCITPFITPPWRLGPRTHIHKTADKARSRHDRAHEKGQSLSIYTDGSGIDGEIGAAAVCPLTQQTQVVHMGPDTVSTVYAAEQQGISLALQIARAYTARGGGRQKVAIYTDNQAAIWSVALKILVRWVTIKSVPTCSALFVMLSGLRALSGDAARMAVRISFSSICGISIRPL
jgi:hypothetical protein